MPFFALGAVDAVLLVAALAALLLLWAGQYFFGLISIVLRHVPVFGGSIANTINSALQAVMQSVVGTLDNAVPQMAHLFWALSVGTWNLLYQSVAAIRDAKVTAQAAGQAAASAQNFAENAVSDAISSANSYADGVGATVLGEAEHLYNLSIATADGLYDQAVAHADDLFNQAEAFSQSVAHDLHVAVDTEIGTVVSGYESLYNQSIAHADTLFDQAEAFSQSVAHDLHVAVDTEIDQALKDAEDFATAAIAAAGVASIAGLLTRVGTLEAEATECLEPLCDTVTPQAGLLGRLGSLLQGLENLAVEGVILALAAEAITNPAAVVNDVSTVVNDVGDGLMTGYRDLVGV